MHTPVIDPQSLPTSMRVAIAIRNAAQNTRANEQDIDDLVASEPVVASSMLHFANSSAFRRRAPVSSIRDATKLLGFATVREIAAHVAMMQLVHGIRAPILRALAEDLFRHSLTVSCIAEFLAADLHHPEPGRVGANALFHELPLFCWLVGIDRAGDCPPTREGVREAAQGARLLSRESVMRDLGLDEFAIPPVTDSSVVELAHGTDWDPNPLVDFRPTGKPPRKLDESRLAAVRRRIEAMHGLIDLSQSPGAAYQEREPEAQRRPPALGAVHKSASLRVIWFAIAAASVAAAAFVLVRMR